jgi:hypothetical protein
MNGSQSSNCVSKDTNGKFISPYSKETNKLLEVEEIDKYVHLAAVASGNVDLENDWIQRLHSVGIRTAKDFIEMTLHDIHPMPTILYLELKAALQLDAGSTLSTLGTFTQWH